MVPVLQVLASVSQHKGINAPSLRSPAVMKKDKAGGCLPWFISVL